MALTGFLTYIGIWDGVGNPPANLRYINSQPGITLEMIQKIQEREKPDTATLWEQINSRALIRFGDRYRAAFGNKYELFCYDEADCSPDKIATDNIDLFGTAWTYCLCSELMTERIFSTKMNRFTTIDREQAVELKAYYDAEFEKALNSAVKHIPRDTISRCVQQCTGGRYYQESTP